MKKMLVLALLSICAFAWRSEDILRTLAAMGVLPASVPALQGTGRAPAVAQVPQQRPKPMSMEEFAKLSKNDPDAYRKFLDSHDVTERSEVDKLFNFLSRGKYE